MDRLTAPSSIFSVRPGSSLSGKPTLDIWVVAPAGGQFRGVIEAAIEITLDPKDATFDNLDLKLAANWTSLGGGGVSATDGQYRVIAALFNSTEVFATERIAATASVNETQRLSMPSWFTTGSFTLSLKNGGPEVWTQPIPAGATAATVQESLNAALGAGSVSVVSVTGSTAAYDVTFGGSLAKVDVDELSIQLYVAPVLQNGQQLLGSFALTPTTGTTAIFPIEVFIDEFTDAAGHTYSDGYKLVDNYALPLDQYTRVIATSGLDAANELSAVLISKALVLGLGGDDKATGLAAGDAFVGGDGTDTAQMADAGPFTVKLVAPSLANYLRAVAEGSAAEVGFSGVASEPMQSMYAIQKSGGAPVYVEAELLQIGTAVPVDPARMLNGATGVKLVGGSDPNAFASIQEAVSAAAAGDLIVVAPDHFEADSERIEVAVNNLRVLLQNTHTDPIDFVLAESTSVRDFSLIGPGNGNIFGNSQANVLIGNLAENLIHGGGGSDTISGGDGDDLVIGGSGNDLLAGDEGWDTVMGGSGSDVLIEIEGGVVGTDAYSAAEDVDLLDGGSGADLLLAGGDDTLHDVRMVGGSGADVFRLFSANGIDSPSNPSPQAFRAFIGDLTSSDGIDLSALRRSSTGVEPLGDIATLTETFSSGDYSLSIGGLFVQGLQAPAPSGSTTRPVAPVDSLAAGSLLGVSVPGSSSAAAVEAVVKAAITRAGTLAQDSGAPYSRSTQQIADSLVALSDSHDVLLDTLYYGL